jgi:hypothetical protein
VTCVNVLAFLHSFIFVFSRVFSCCCCCCCCCCTVYNMSDRVVADIQTRAEGESLYIRYNTDANVVNDLKRLILWVHWRSNFKNKRYLSRENQSLSLCKSTWICITYTDTTRLIYDFSLCFLHELLMSFLRQFKTVWAKAHDAVSLCLCC